MRYTSIFLLAVVAVITADSPLPLEEVEEVQISNTDIEYRLPEDLDPESYDIEVTPYFEDSDPNVAFSFDGVVKITFKAINPGLNSFVIQENVREIKNVKLHTYILTAEEEGEEEEEEEKVEVPLHAENSFERIKESQFLKINLPAEQTLNTELKYVLTVEYVGNINETPLQRGVFRGNYKDESGTVRWYLATHLQPTHSRQAFPSFDEPGFKSTFKITINRPESFSESYSNMPLESPPSPPVNGRVREVFEVTPRMSAYLVSFHVHDGFKTIAEHNDAQRPYRILARPTAEGQGEYALKVGPPLTDWLSEYFKIDYYEMEPKMKNDQIASPFWASGATENWGLVTYRELRLLYEEGETNEVDKLSIGTITAHELAHKWFGNLITCKWWDNVWINEGFASYFEYFAMDGAYPDLQLADQFNIMYVQSALSADSGATTRALTHTVNSPAEVTGHFTGISYSKGASLLLMLKHLVTEDTFKKALNYFLIEKSNEHALPEDLYNNFYKAVEEDGIAYTGLDIKSFMKYWVEEQGYPVLNVKVNSETGIIILEQNRFLLSGLVPLGPPQFWPLPLTYTTANSPNWNNLQPVKVMTERVDYIENAAINGWVIFNIQQKNLYRVNYDPKNWRLIADALNENVDSIHHLNRAQIVDDVFALMRANRMSFELGFRVLEFLKKDTSYYSWYPAISGFNWLRNRFLHLPEKLAQFNRILNGYLDAVIADLGYNVVPNEHLTRTLNRFYVLSFACNIGYPGCVSDAIAKFYNYYNNADIVSINPNLRRHVFCEGLRAGGYAQWSFLNNRRQNSNNQADDNVMLRALGCTTNPQARTEYLENILKDEYVKAQDRVNAFTWFYMGHRSNARFALSFLKDRVQEIHTAVVLPAWFGNVLSNIAGYLDPEGLDEMRAWILANEDSIPNSNAGISAINSAQSSIAWGTTNADRILAALNQGATTEASTESSTESSTDSSTDSSTSDSTSTSTSTEPTTTDDPNSAEIYMPTTILLLWTALAMLLK